MRQEDLPAKPEYLIMEQRRRELQERFQTSMEQGFAPNTFSTSNFFAGSRSLEQGEEYLGPKPGLVFNASNLRKINLKFKNVIQKSLKLSLSLPQILIPISLQPDVHASLKVA